MGAPSWVWGDDQETNFDRLSFYPRRKLRLPSRSAEGQKSLNAQLLKCWLGHPLNFHFIFSSPIVDFKVVAVPTAEEEKNTQAQYKIFQRLKGWVLCDSDGLCLIALREENIWWYENSLLISFSRDNRASDKRLQQTQET